LGASVELAPVPLTQEAQDNTPEATLINETQARFLIQVDPEDAESVLSAIRGEGCKATLLGEINNTDEVVFTYNGDTIAVIPNNPSAEVLAELG
jgi:phosphoribosylformylglycinamidine (FGAM) synthase-like enzyme